MKRMDYRNLLTFEQSIVEGIAPLESVKDLVVATRFTRHGVLKFSVSVDPMMMRSLKVNMGRVFKDLGDLVFSTLDAWVENVSETLLLLIYENGMQVIVQIVPLQNNQTTIVSQFIPEYVHHSVDPDPMPYMVEACYAAIRHLLIGDFLSGQCDYYRFLDALKYLLLQRYVLQGREIQGEKSASLLTWRDLVLVMPDQLTSVLEKMNVSLSRDAIGDCFVQLVNITLTLIEGLPDQQFAKVPLMGLIHVRDAMAQALVFNSDYLLQAPEWHRFNALSKEIFQLDFEPWFRSGGWNQNYKPYTFFFKDQAVANVSISLMSLLIEGKQTPAIQVGTVMTAEKWRRRGLAYQLFQRIFSDFPPSKYLYFLAADAMAVDLYRACGFDFWTEAQFYLEVPVDTLKADNALPSSYERLSEDMAYWTELYMQSAPLSTRLAATDDHSIMLFYYQMGLGESLYRFDDQTHAILTIEEGVLNVYRMFWDPDKAFDYSNLVGFAMDHGCSRIEFLFTPDCTAVDSLQIQSVPDSQGNWMVHQGYPVQFPKDAKFPKISQT